MGYTDGNLFLMHGQNKKDLYPLFSHTLESKNNTGRTRLPYLISNTDKFKKSNLNIE